MKEYPKECPFCHNLPDIAKSPLWNGSHGYHGRYNYYIACRNENCKMKPKTYEYEVREELCQIANSVTETLIFVKYR